MIHFKLLLWMWIAASLAFAGDGLISQGKTRTCQDCGNVLFAFSGSMLLVAIVAIFRLA